MAWTREQKIEYAREYYRKNREAILKKKREKESDPEVRQKLKEYLATPEIAEHRRNYTRKRREDESYREAELSKGREHRAERRKRLNDIQMHYKCRNPDCPWKGEYTPEMLDFHHYDPESKSGQISLMLSSRTEKLAAEVNKCIILCRNCHALFHSGKVRLNERMLCRVSEELELLK
jgi:predicted ATP-binding protein involved in virulence